MNNVYQIDEKTRIKFCRDYLFDQFSKYRLQRLYKGKWVTTEWAHATKRAGNGFEQVCRFDDIESIVRRLYRSEDADICRKYTSNQDPSIPVWEQSND